MGDGAVNEGKKSTDYTPNLTVPLFEKHPTPWRFVRQVERRQALELKDSILANGYDDVSYVPKEPECDVIVDANGNKVMETWDTESYASGFEGDVRFVVDFINTVGAALPRLLKLDVEDRMRRAAEPGYNPDNNLDLLVQRLNETKPWET